VNIFWLEEIVFGRESKLFFSKNRINLIPTISIDSVLTMANSSPPGGEPQAPNQFNTPCCVIFRLGEINSQHQLCGDLQEAYIWARDMMELYVAEGETWVLKSWPRTIRGAFECFQNNSVYEVARGPNKSVYLYYYI
jgi:hypothetical protein